MKYECNTCVYETCDFGNFSRHMKSKKHLNNVELGSVIIQKTPKDNPRHVNDNHSSDSGGSNTFTKEENQLVCENCNGVFKHYQNLWRHRKYRCTKKNINKSDLFMEIDKEKEIIRNKLKETEDKLKQEEYKCNKLLNIINNTTETNNKSMSVLNFLTKKYADAPPVELLGEDGVIGLIKFKTKTNKTIEDFIIYYFEQGELDKFIGDMIILEYKKDNPAEQSIWASDRSRLNFIIKQLMVGTDRSEWITDKSGIKITNLVITPILEKINQILGDHVKLRNKLIIQYSDSKNVTIDDIAEIHESIVQIIGIQKHINSKKLHTEILRYIAPAFNFNENKSTK